MRKMRFLAPVGFLLLILGLGAIVMLLWNWLIPGIFGLAIINYWQALGLLILARILFGGFGSGRRMFHGRMMHGHGGNPIREKWMKMTPEQRKEFVKKRRDYMHGGHAFGKHDFFGMHDFDPDDNSQKRDE